MANKASTLVWYCRTENGWRRYPVVKASNGKIKTGVVLLDGKEVSYPEGRFQVRTYQGTKTVYSNAGESATDATLLNKKTTRLLDIKTQAVDAGLKIVEPSKRIAIRSAVQQYIERAKNSRQFVAAEVYQNALADFMLHTQVDYVDEIDESVMLKFCHGLRKAGNKDRTIANKYANVKGFLIYNKVNVKELGLRIPKYTKKVPVVYTQKEVEALLTAAARDREFHVVLKLLLMTGIREQEGAHLMWQDIRFDRSIIQIRPNPDFLFQIKDYEERHVPMHPELAAVLKEWRKLNPRTKFVVGSKQDTPARHWLRRLKKLAKRSGLNCGQCSTCKKNGQCARWTLHSFRRTYATILHRQGVDMRTLMKLLGHSNLPTTQGYLAARELDQSTELLNSIKWFEPQAT